MMAPVSNGLMKVLLLRVETCTPVLKSLHVLPHC